MSETHYRQAIKARASGKKPPLGTGQRFKQLEGKLSKRGVRNPGALAAWIGRKNLGSKKMAQLSVAGRRRH